MGQIYNPIFQQHTITTKFHSKTLFARKKEEKKRKKEEENKTKNVIITIYNLKI